MYDPSQARARTGEWTKQYRSAPNQFPLGDDPYATSLLDAPRLIVGIVGSRGYGLHHANSDTDRLAIAPFPTRRLIGVFPPRSEDLTYHATGDEDITIHEVGKFTRLALNNNPTVTELMWLHEDNYESSTDYGDELREIRSDFLNATGVRNAYLGYATSQFRGVERGKSGAKDEKYRRHFYRLCLQARHAWETGEIKVMLDESERERTMEFGRVATIDDMRTVMERTEAVFEEPTPLPENSRTDRVEDWLQRIRHDHY